MISLLLLLAQPADAGRMTFEEFVIEGEVLKPDVTVVISRENLNKSYNLELKESFLDKIGETFGTVEAVKTVADLIAPASGEVLKINESLEEDAEQINKDPYGAGWMLKVRIDEPGDIEQLLSAREYAEVLANH